MKKAIFFITTLFVFSSFIGKKQNNNNDRDKVNAVLDNWHKAAAETNYTAYFNSMTDDAIFIGTDATENWKKADFEVWAKPFFDRKKAWSFTTIERHIYFDASGKIAWFDELLDTQMKICRGSGVLVKVGKEWKIKHYVLSMTVPNDNSDAIVKIKAPIEDALIQKLKTK